MAEFIVNIDDRIVEELEKQRKQNTAPRKNPDNPEEVISGPVHKSVAEMIQVIVDQGIAPIAANVPSPEAEALANEIDEKMERLKKMTRPTIEVRQA
ncbi:MAG: hypothetical protein QM757_16595 [Paludibaculum sp.]